MWASGVVDLGLTPEAFWNLTYHEFSLLSGRFVAREDRENRRAALIACHIANYAGKMRKPGEDLTVEQILGTVPPESDLERFKRQAKDPIGDYVRGLEASDPQSQIFMDQAILDAAARGLGTWSKLGPEARLQADLLQPLAIIEAMKKRAN